MRTVYVIEKPLITRALLPHLLAHHGAEPFGVIETRGLGFYRFRYPRGLSWRDYPFVGEPTYQRHADWDRNSPVRWVVKGVEIPAGADVEAAIREAEKVVFACDPDRTGVHAFQVLLREARGVGVPEQIFPALYVAATDADSLAAAVASPGHTSDAWFQDALRDAEAKRYFEFNWDANAMAVFGRVWQRLVPHRRTAPSPHELALLGASWERAIGASPWPLGKYGLQLLYALRNVPPLSEGAVMRRMVEWRGTGRYPEAVLGSPMSQHAIIQSLVSAGLLGGGPKALAITARGHALLAALHPDCEDADLPMRLDAWMRDWPASRPVMERYLRTVFGKQARFEPSAAVEVAPAPRP